MIVILPDRTNGLPGLESSVTLDSLDAWIAGTARVSVEVCLPRFSLDFRKDIVGVLPTLGINEALGQIANFSRMTATQERIYIDQVQHAAVLDADEKGTEAAAATAVVMRGWGGVKAKEELSPVVFRADHPFLFAIRESKSGTLLFLGRVVRPEPRKS